MRDRGSVGQNKSALVCVRVASDNDSNKKIKLKFLVSDSHTLHVAATVTLVW